ncbi:MULTISPECIES: GntP family permease [unclassified Chelatococcus]|uniref:GntP family permease n=1 Tax=unclassified Chelatococcus TaxID=2638111 RepID=UPI001BCB1592|nr:GntP family permease [Chelatococcus sp.]MBS7698889.1 GntP family permease [Chelatococcus sp. YT9]MBX3559535.1 GntP family permease [Chelatococcus sp.]
MGLIGILVALALLIWLAYRGWSVLMVAPLAGLAAAFIAGEPILPHWTQTFMPGAARFVAQWFPIFLLGGLFGKLMDDSGSIASIANFLTRRLGTKRTILSVVLASAIVTYGGVSVFVAFFVLVPMAQRMFEAADIPRRLMPATIGLGAFTFTMTALPGTPSVNNAIPMPYFGTTTFAAPGIGIIASAITLAFGLWWLARQEAAARLAGEGFGVKAEVPTPIDQKLRDQATATGDFDPAELEHGKRAEAYPPFALAALPLVVVIVVNFLMALVVLPRLDFSFLSEPAWGATNFSAVGGIWSVMLALAAANLTVILVNFRRMPNLMESLDAGANSAALPMLMIASLVGFGAIIAALPAFAQVRDAVLAIPGGPLISLTVAMNTLAALTGTASGGSAIALNALGDHFLSLATTYGIDPALMHRVTVISAGTLDALPHNGTVLMLLQISKLTHAESYKDMIMTVIVGVVISLIAILVLGSFVGSF